MIDIEIKYFGHIETVKIKTPKIDNIYRYISRWFQKDLLVSHDSRRFKDFKVYLHIGFVVDDAPFCHQSLLDRIQYVKGVTDD